MDKFYITTAIDYPNALPHIGTAFEKIGADVQARFQRMRGRDVYFLMGNDENTVKVIKAAQSTRYTSAKEFTIKNYADSMATAFKDVWRNLLISNNDFIQTSEDRHFVGVQRFIIKVNEAGYIYKKFYEAPYCEGCEEFKTEKSLVNGRCPNHPNSALEARKEENYFFRLSAFKDRVKQLLDTTIEVLPDSRLNEMRAILDGDLDDISISRSNQGWGIPIPWDNSQTIYVWFDALLNYLTGVGFGLKPDKFAKWHPADCHVIGKDITRFHCIIFPAMIAAYNEKAETPIAFPKQIFAHGFIYRKKGEEAVKESKSAGAMNPLTLIEKYGADAYRYYFTAKCSFGSDSEYSPEHIQETYNGDLANNLGNLLSRTTAMAMRYLDGKLTGTERFAIDVNAYAHMTETFQYRAALETIWGLLRDANGFIEDQKPWAMTETADRDRCISKVAHLLRAVSLMLKPYMPTTAYRVYNVFVDGETDFNECTLKTLQGIAETSCPLYVSHGALLSDKTLPPLFPRIA